MNPRDLKSHIKRALGQSQNEHIAHVKIMSSNQLKSRDLSLRTATTSETQALRQFADDWVSRVGNGAYVRNPTYGILAHGIRTSAMEMDKFEGIRDNILQDNRPFVSRAKIKYVGWLTRNAASKSASSVLSSLRSRKMQTRSSTKVCSGRVS
jgi:ribosomal protein L20